MNTIWLNVDRTSAVNLQNSLAAFAHQSAGGNCNFTGAASGNALVTGWVSTVRAAGSGLPGSTSAMQQVTVNTAPGGFNRVTVTVCWQPPRATER